MSGGRACLASKESGATLTGASSSTWLGALIRSQPERAGEQCPNENTLAAFVEHNLVPVELRAIWEHLAECGECRRLVLFAATPPVERQQAPKE